MRNREAARYARWAAIAAGVAALAVAGVYVERAIGRARALRLGPAAVPLTVAQQSDQFSFSKVDQNRTLFTVRASHLTQYKDQNRALLRDVWITIYGRDGRRNDNIHTRECSYEPDTGVVLCQGAVEIDVDGARPGAHTPASAASSDTLQVKTSDLSFNRDSGQASTSAPVDFSFSGGTGHGVGVSYSTDDSIVRLQHDVEFHLAASPKVGDMPVSATGSSLEINRNARQVVLLGPATVREGTRELAADKITIGLDQNDRARTILADGHPQLHADEGGAKIGVTATRFEGALSPDGQVEHVVADGDVIGTRDSPKDSDRFSSDRVEIAMVPGKNLIQDMTATGSVVAESHQGADSRVLKTAALRVKFGAVAGSPGKQGAAIEQQRIESAETLAPATIESRSGDATTTLAAKQFVAQLADGRRLEKLFGHSGVQVRSQNGAAPPQLISAAEMAVTFAPNGDWDVLDESGDVHFMQADRSATAAHARIVQSTDTITLDGSPVISDAISRTTAANATINQKSGDLRLSGGVASTYLPASGPRAGQADAVGFGAGAAHISADTLTGSINAGHVTYAGHARLWQGESVLDADSIELWRDDKKLQATGHVVAVFPQSSGPFATPFGQAAEPHKVSGRTAPSPAASSGPTLWKVVAPSLTYWADQGKAHLEGGVVASSDQGALASRTLDVFLTPATPASPANSANLAAAPPQPGAAISPAPGGRQLDRVLAQGGVVVRQGDRRGMAEQGEYTAADGKFVLSGGQPTVSDSSSNTATGRSLTFFVANDTILIDSQEGSRTLTKHRVEK
ncbi:MAG TPA: LptA/OstA family protein [Candidatus Baltobacteraceae bacterium]|nr:LptA/OstA family protein [Candidatus Baltobacteraceae bacterium]